MKSYLQSPSTSTRVKVEVLPPEYYLPEQGLPGQPDVVLGDGLPGEHEEEQQRGNPEERGPPGAGR